MCKFNTALHGRPELGAPREAYSTAIIHNFGGCPIPGRPSCSTSSDSKQPLTACIDDFLMTGPIDAREVVWNNCEHSYPLRIRRPLISSWGERTSSSTCLHQAVSLRYSIVRLRCTYRLRRRSTLNDYDDLL